MKNKKKIVLLGSTGSIGCNVLRVIEDLKENFTVVGLSAKDNEKVLIEQANKFKPSYTAIVDEKKVSVLKRKLNYRCKVDSGTGSLIKLAALPEAELVVIATTGISGLLPLRAAIEAGKNVALANKEPLVAAGRLIKKFAEKKKVQLIPMDSEHSAIFQCVENRQPQEIKKIILTASGGPFYRRAISSLKKIKPKEALNHPLWKMGPKISIDSATMINKGLEVMEAQHLFNLKLSQIEILIHPQGVIHSLVELIDGSVFAFMSRPDMRLPIQYALTYPKRKKNDFPPLKTKDITNLNFYKPDYQRFPGLKLALNSARIGGTMPAVFNAANEEAVSFFLKEKLDFLGIASLIKEVIEVHKVVMNPSLNRILDADRWARQECLKIIKGQKH